MVQLWEVVGGADRGGILVRRGQDISSDKYEERLSTGALVEEVKLAGDRLGYKRITGTGPSEGWVSVSLQGKQLVTRTTKKPPRKEPPPPPKPREEPRPAPVQEPPRKQPAAPPDPLARGGAAPAAPPPEPAAGEAAPASDDPIHLGDFGESEQRSKYRIRAMPPVAGVPAGGFVGSIAWDVPMGQIHEALLAALGLDRGLLSIGWRGRDMQDDLTLLESDTIGNSRGARQRALEMTVELVFMLERGVVIKMPARGATAASAASASASSAAPAQAPAAGSATAAAAASAAAAPRAAAPRQYAAQLDQLASMGFTDESLVVPLLKAKHGNVQAVIEALLA